MLDQNITTIITTTITAISTLSGAILGVLLANRHNEKQHKIREAEERGLRKKKIIEETYDLTTEVGRWIKRKDPQALVFIGTSSDSTEYIQHCLDAIAKNITLYINNEEMKLSYNKFSARAEWIIYYYNRSYEKCDMVEVTESFVRFASLYQDLINELTKEISKY